LKHIDLFGDFLRNTVNLNDTRVVELEISVNAIKDAVRDSRWEPRIKGWMAHGSWAHRTIIKPVDNGEFDADLIVFVEHVRGWTAARYIDELYNALRSNKIYEDKVSRSSHCITVRYANDKKIDVAPCVANRRELYQLEVCNRASDRFERTEPKKYTEWLVQQNGYSGGNSFRKVTRLIKYLRDIKKRFTCPSVLLTTILGTCISPSDRDSAEFTDTPTALRTVFTRMDDWLQDNPSKPAVTNPFLLSENFADLWTDEQYTNFRDKIHTYCGWVEDAYEEQDHNESLAKWRRVFGRGFAKGEALEEARIVTDSTVRLLKSSTATAAVFSGDLVEAVRRYGFRILPPRFYRLPYMDKPKWKQADSLILVRVRADLHVSEHGKYIGPVEGPEPLAAGRWLHFYASTNAGMPFNAKEYTVYWRITNTDEEAYAADCLRGGFYKPEDDNTKWERLLYRGVHIAEAFIVRKRGNLLVGKSEPFQVVIG
jgi:hypothetical protein